jgi:IS30 family transposase
VNRFQLEGLAPLGACGFKSRLRHQQSSTQSFAGFTQRELTAIERELNERPRKTLNWVSPLEALNELVASTI